MLARGDMPASTFVLQARSRRWLASALEEPRAVAAAQLNVEVREFWVSAPQTTPLTQEDDSDTRRAFQNTLRRSFPVCPMKSPQLWFTSDITKCQTVLYHIRIHHVILYRITISYPTAVHFQHFTPPFGTVARLSLVLQRSNTLHPRKDCGRPI